MSVRTHAIRALALLLFCLTARPAPCQDEDPGPSPLDMSGMRIRAWFEAGADTWAIYEALSQGDLAKAESLAAAGVRPEDRFASAVHYTYGSPEVRAFIRRYAPAEVARGDFDFLALILREETSTGSRTGDPADFYPFPVASTYLEDEKDALRYAPDKAFDGNLDTAWVEGVQGAGAGQRIAFFLPAEAVSIGVLPGYGDATWFSQNHRVKRAVLTIHRLGCFPSQIGFALVFFPDARATVELVFRDEMTLQVFGLPRVESEGYLVAVLEIAEVFPTQRWADTCVSEIRLFDSSQKALEAGP